MGASTSFFMPDTNQPEKLPAPPNAAMLALEFIVSKYAPATILDADTFFTTPEISQAIAQHTGTTLSAAEIYEMMINMQYTYEALNGLELNWLLKKE